MQWQGFEIKDNKFKFLYSLCLLRVENSYNWLGSSPLTWKQWGAFQIFCWFTNSWTSHSYLYTYFPLLNSQQLLLFNSFSWSYFRHLQYFGVWYCCSLHPHWLFWIILWFHYLFLFHFLWLASRVHGYFESYLMTFCSCNDEIRDARLSFIISLMDLCLCFSNKTLCSLSLNFYCSMMITINLSSLMVLSKQWSFLIGFYFLPFQIEPMTFQWPKHLFPIGFPSLTSSLKLRSFQIVQWVNWGQSKWNILIICGSSWPHPQFSSSTHWISWFLYSNCSTLTKFCSFTWAGQYFQGFICSLFPLRHLCLRPLSDWIISLISH